MDGDKHFLSIAPPYNRCVRSTDIFIAGGGIIGLSTALELAASGLSVTVLERGLRNYLAGAADELAADLAPGAEVSLPSSGLVLQSLQRPSWAAPGVVLAVLQARDQRGVQYTLAYEVRVGLQDGRWEISAIETGGPAS